MLEMVAFYQEVIGVGAKCANFGARLHVLQKQTLLITNQLHDRAKYLNALYLSFLVSKTRIKMPFLLTHNKLIER